jgi:hypothetical protein
MAISISYKGLSSDRVNIAISSKELALVVVGTDMRLPLSKLSTIIPLFDDATNLNRPCCPEIAKISFKVIIKNNFLSV